MERNGTKRNRIKSLPPLRTPEGRSMPGMAPPSACSSGSLRRSREDGNLASLSRPQPLHVPGRSAQQMTSTRQFTVANMSQSEYDDSNAAARPMFRPVACVTHLHTPPRFLQAWRGLLLPGPIPGVAKVHHRSLSQRLSPGGGATDPGSCLSPSPVYERNETK